MMYLLGQRGNFTDYFRSSFFYFSSKSSGHLGQHRVLLLKFLSPLLMNYISVLLQIHRPTFYTLIFTNFRQHQDIHILRPHKFYILCTT